MRITFTSARSLTLGVAVAFVTAACSVGSGDGADGDEATIGFATPSDGATVSAPFDVELEASVPLDEPGTGNHHAHIYFDASTDSADYDIVYGTTWQVERPLTAGEHTMIVALANPDHSLAGPTQEIRVTVDGEGGGSDADSSASPAPTIEY